MSTKEIGGNLTASGLKACIVVSRFNDFLTKQLLNGAVDCVVRHGGEEKDLTVIWVPGANELPMVAKKAAQSGKFGAVIALGAVIQGATRHAELINAQVSRSLGSIAMETGQVLYLDEYIVSPNGRYRFHLQVNGNLLIRDTQTGLAIWAAATVGTSASFLLLQDDDSNLVLYSTSDLPLWASNTVGTGAWKLVLNDSGILELHASDTVVWSRPE